MVKRDDVQQATNDLLGQEFLDRVRSMDPVANGIQFHGSDEVSKIALGTSLNLEFLEAAVKWSAEYCIFHHGFDVRTYLSQYASYTLKRMKLILGHNLTIAGYHAALDMHPELGNNAVILERLGAKRGDTLYEGWGFVGHFDEPVSVSELKHTCKTLFDHEVLAFDGDGDVVQTIGVCSGGAKPYDEHIYEMQQKGVELFISGETSESAPHKMMESGIHYFVCGHYATEVFGVQALGAKLSEHFGDALEVKFIDVPNVV